MLREREKDFGLGVLTTRAFMEAIDKPVFMDTCELPVLAGECECWNFRGEFQDRGGYIVLLSWYLAPQTVVMREKPALDERLWGFWEVLQRHARGSKLGHRCAGWREVSAELLSAVPASGIVWMKGEVVKREEQAGEAQEAA